METTKRKTGVKSWLLEMEAFFADMKKWIWARYINSAFPTLGTPNEIEWNRNKIMYFKDVDFLLKYIFNESSSSSK